MKLSRMLGTSVNYWLNLRNAYDALIAEFGSEKELDEERSQASTIKATGSAADQYAEDTLIPKKLYQKFISSNEKFDLQLIKNFAKQIDRDPGIVLGRLQNDGRVRFDDWTLSSLRHKYRVQIGM